MFFFKPSWFAIIQQQPFAAAMPVDVSEVVKDWMAVETIKSRAAVYKLMSYELGINPEAAESHSVVLSPLMQHLGLLDANISHVTKMFMKHAVFDWSFPGPYLTNQHGFPRS